MSTWVIGDVHGCYYTLVQLLDRIKTADTEANFVFVGDYVDRGMNNKEVIDLVIALQKQGAVCLRGNHDNVVDWILNDGHCKGHMSEFVSGKPSVWNVIPWWRMNGLDETLGSYGVDVGKIANDLPNVPYANSYSIRTAMSKPIHEEFVKNVPDSHKEFFRDLPIYWNNDTHFACHAFYRPDVRIPRDVKFLSAEYDDEALWSRFSPWHVTECKPIWDKIGVFGHTPVVYYGASTPIKAEKIRLIDTGACMRDGGYLCGYNMATDDFILQATDSRDLFDSFVTKETEL